MIDEYNLIKEQQACISKTIDALWEKYQKLQVDYEARLNADMAAMLTEIQITLEEMLANETLSDNRREISDVGVGIELCLPVIQEKINSLKEQT